MDRTIVDVLDDFFTGSWVAGSIDRLKDDEIEALAGDVDDFYASYSTPSDEAIIRSYSGGAAWSGNSDLADEPRLVSTREVLPFAHAAVLYSEQVLFDCPLDAWICSYRDYPKPGSFRGNNGMVVTPLVLGETYGDGFARATIEESRERIKAALERLDVVAPAIRSGWLLPVPHLRYWQARRQQIVSSVRHDVADPRMFSVMSGDYSGPPAMADNVRGMNIVPDGGVHPRDSARATIEGPSIYFNSILAVADSTDSRFLPTADSDYAILREKIMRAAKQAKSVQDGLAVHSLHSELMPTFDDETFSVVCDIRNSESVFAEWRDEVAALASGETIDGEGGVERAQEVVDERLRDRCARIRASISKTKTLSGRLQAATEGGKELGADIGLAAAVWAVPPEASVVKLLAGVSAPLLRRALKAAAPTTGGSASVLMKLDKRRTPR